MKKRKTILLVISLLSLSCDQPIPTVTSPVYNLIDDQEYLNQVENVIQVWDSHEALQYFDTAKCDITNVKYSSLEDSEFMTLTGGICPIPPEDEESCLDYWLYSQNIHCPSCAYSFYDRGSQTIYFGNRVFQYSNSDFIVKNIFIHESIHWLSNCTDHEDTIIYSFNPTSGKWIPSYPYQNSDAMHLDANLWHGPSSVLRVSENL